MAGAVTDTFTYDPSGQRLSLNNGSTTTYYASKFYNTNGTKAQKHIFANGVEVATVEGTGEKALLHSTATDNLTGSNIVTDSGNNTEEVLDYFPFGSVRIDQKSGSYGDQRQYAGSELDGDTGLNYMQARYYDSSIGRFVSEDPAFYGNLQAGMLDPQQLNSYSYSRNNPINYVDPSGDTAVAIALLIPELAAIPAEVIGAIGFGIGLGIGAIPTKTTNDSLLLTPQQKAAISPPAPYGPVAKVVPSPSPTHTGSKPKITVTPINKPQGITTITIDGVNWYVGPGPINRADTIPESDIATIAGDHGWNHRKQFPGVETPEDLENEIGKVLNSPDTVIASGKDDRTAYAEPTTGVVVVHDPNSPHKGTVFKPDKGAIRWVKENFDK